VTNLHAILQNYILEQSRQKAADIFGGVLSRTPLILTLISTANVGWGNEIYYIDKVFI